MPTPAEIRALNEVIFDQLASPGRNSEAVEAINNFTWSRMRAEPLTITSYDAPFDRGSKYLLFRLPDAQRIPLLWAMILVWHATRHQ